MLGDYYMTLKIKKDARYSNRVIAKDIHGKHPYKLYLEVRGNSTIGRYIVVISDRQLNKEDNIDEIIIQLDTNNRIEKKKDNGVLRPNMLNGSVINRYKVFESSIIDVGNTPINVYVQV